MEKRYVALRVYATICKIMGVLVALLTVLVIILLVVAATSFASRLAIYGINSPGLVILSAVGMLIGGGMWALGLFALGELLSLFVNIEENTRYSAILLRDRQPQ